MSLQFFTCLYCCSLDANVLALGWLASKQIEMSSATAMGEHHSMLAVTTRRTKLQKGFHEFHEPCLQVWNCESNTWIQLVHSFEVLVLLWFCYGSAVDSHPTGARQGEWATWACRLQRGLWHLRRVSWLPSWIIRFRGATSLHRPVGCVHPKLGRCGFSQL